MPLFRTEFSCFSVRVKLLLQLVTFSGLRTLYGDMHVYPNSQTTTRLPGAPFKQTGLHAQQQNSLEVAEKES